MKKSAILVLIISLSVTLTACGGNRLKDTLAAQATVTNNGPTEAANEDPVAAPTPDGRNLQPQLANANINLDEVVALLPPDVIPAVLPEQATEIMVTAGEAENLGITSSVRVIGVSINGDSRAYPVPYMSSHEIVNDEVGGRLIAATW